MIFLCEECDGAGAVAFDRGPAAENCTRCGGVGLVMTDPLHALSDLQRLFSVTPSDEGVIARAAPGAEWRLLLTALQHLQQRVEELERKADTGR